MTCPRLSSWYGRDGIGAWAWPTPKSALREVKHPAKAVRLQSWGDWVPNPCLLTPELSGAVRPQGKA